MFKATIEDIALLRDPLDVISNFITEGTFTVNKNGLSLVAMDQPASVVMVLFDLLSSSFAEFDVSGESKLTLNIPYFVSILKRAGAGDLVSFKLAEGDSVLKVTLKGDSKRVFTIPLLETMGKPPEAPKKLDEGFKALVEVESNVLKEGTKDALMVSDSVVFKADNDSFNLLAFGDTSQVNLSLTKGSPSLLNLNVDAASKAKYSLEYLEKIMKASKIADTLTIKFADDFPLRLDYKVIDKLRLSFILAPRIDME